MKEVARSDRGSVRRRGIARSRCTGSWICIRDIAVTLGEIRDGFLARMIVSVTRSASI